MAVGSFAVVAVVGGGGAVGGVAVGSFAVVVVVGGGGAAGAGTTDIVGV